MGIQGLTKLLQDHAANCLSVIPYAALPKGTYGVDVSDYLYPTKYRATSKGRGAHLRWFLEFIVRLRKVGIKPIMVMDGDVGAFAPKAATLAARAVARVAAAERIAAIPDQAERAVAQAKQIQITSDDYAELLHLFQTLGVEVYRATHEADQGLAQLYRERRIIGVFSEDSDMLAWGIDLVVRGLLVASWRNTDLVQTVCRPLMLSELNLTDKQFLDLCILAGCDYVGKLAGIGIRTGYSLVRQFGPAVAGRLPIMLKSSGYAIPEQFAAEYTTAINVFTNKEPCLQAIEPPKEPQTRAELLAWILARTNYTPKTLSSKLAELS
jgi:5'-3' exonuclease